MTLEELDKYAYTGEQPEKTEWPEFIYWLAAACIYAAFRLGLIDAGKSKEYKKRLRDIYSEVLAMNNLYKHTAKMWAQIEATGSAYRKNRTLENADAFMNAVYGVYHTSNAAEVINATD